MSRLPLFRGLGSCVGIAAMATGLAACGGGGPSTSSTSATTTSAPTSRPVTVPSRPSHKPQPRTSSSVTAHPSHGPAGFRVRTGDNSIPDFGREAPASQRQLAVAALTAFMRARARGEWAKVCEYLARPNHKFLESFMKASKGKIKSCGAALGGLMTGPASSRADTLTHGVSALRIKGKTAFALFYGSGSSKYVMPMRNEGGAWKMTQLAPLPYPLGTPTTGTP